MRQRFDDLSPEELDSIRLFIEAANIQVVTDEIREIVETHWPWLIEKLPAPASHKLGEQKQQDEKR